MLDLGLTRRREVGKEGRREDGWAFEGAWRLERRRHVGDCFFEGLGGGDASATRGMDFFEGLGAWKDAATGGDLGGCFLRSPSGRWGFSFWAVLCC